MFNEPAIAHLDRWLQRFVDEWFGPVGYAVCMPCVDKVVYFDNSGDMTDERGAFVGTKREATELMCHECMRDVYRWTRLIPVKLVPSRSPPYGMYADKFLSFPSMCGGSI